MLLEKFSVFVKEDCQILNNSSGESLPALTVTSVVENVAGTTRHLILFPSAQRDKLNPDFRRGYPSRHILLPTIR